jgi:phage N-6-adenine-methyltransferase
MNTDVMFSSSSDNWATPQEFFDVLNDEFGFTVDVCASEDNHKCPEYYTMEDNGLIQEWAGVCWMNPLYGRTINEWIKKAYESKATVVCLVPARTDTKWWHNYAMKSKEIRLVSGRLKFGGHKNSAPFPSAVVVFDGQDHDTTVFKGVNRC